MPRLPLNRRTFLRSAGVCIGLPLLDAMLPIGLGADQKAAAMRPKRMLLISRPLGLHAPHFFPEKPGKTTNPSRYLKPLQDHRRDFTVFSGMSHVGYPGGHHTEVALLTGVAPEGRPVQRHPQHDLARPGGRRPALGGETRFALPGAGRRRPVVEPQGA